MRFDLSTHLVETSRHEIKESLKKLKVYVCMGNRLLLNSFSLVPAINDNLVGNSTTEDEALEDCLKLFPDVFFVTETLEVGYGPSLIEKAKTYVPEIKTLIFLESETNEMVDKCLSSRADAVIFTSSLGTGDGDLVKAVRRLSRNLTYFPNDVVQNIGISSSKYDILNELSEREAEVLRCISDGFTNDEIAKTLVVSENTVKTHVRNILLKLGERDRTALAVLALKNGITSDNPIS